MSPDVGHSSRRRRSGRVAAAVLATALITAPAATGAEVVAPPAIDLQVGPDLAWTRIAFDEPERWRGLVAAAQRRRAELLAAKQAALAAELSGARLQSDSCFEDVACSAVLEFEALRPRYASREALDAARASAVDWVAVAAAPAMLAGQSLPAMDAASDRAALILRQVRDQALRYPLVMLDNPAATPSVAEPARRLAVLGLRLEMKRADTEATAFLRALLARGGWPSADPAGSKAAWLVVQHADSDPAFQAQVLQRLGGDLAATQVSPKEYAYLYDRVHLAALGRQRYGTQVQCEGGQWQVSPLEDAGAVARYRAAAGLAPLERYLKTFSDPCR